MCCNHVPYVLVDLVLHVGNSEQSLETFVFKCLYPVFGVRVKRPGFAAVHLNFQSLYLMLMELLVHNLLSLAIAVVAMVILISISAVSVPSLDSAVEDLFDYAPPNS
ncbi:hypothetical protein DPMN_021153 [Dreissena polymorpha]|uniref:Uncharacterized protein n=1 Tax=Dreissena polymorpha TaxID=45954 RepID=A0A9D4S8X1_DREPO|nr:hypothetical protein DPMN_021153 [Dreissena polymorpha]